MVNPFGKSWQIEHKSHWQMVHLPMQPNYEQQGTPAKRSAPGANRKVSLRANRKPQHWRMSLASPLPSISYHCLGWGTTKPWHHLQDPLKKRCQIWKASLEAGTISGLHHLRGWFKTATNTKTYINTYIHTYIHTYIMVTWVHLHLEIDVYICRYSYAATIVPLHVCTHSMQNTHL